MRSRADSLSETGYVPSVVTQDTVFVPSAMKSVVVVSVVSNKESDTISPEVNKPSIAEES